MVELVRRLGWSYVSTVAAEVNNPESLVHYQQHYNIIVFTMVIMYKGLSIYYVIRNGGGLLWKAPIRVLSGPRLINIYGKTAKKPDPSLSPKRLQTSALPIQVDLPRQ